MPLVTTIILLFGNYHIVTHMSDLRWNIEAFMVISQLGTLKWNLRCR